MKKLINDIGLLIKGNHLSAAFATYRFLIKTLLKQIERKDSLALQETEDLLKLTSYFAQSQLEDKKYIEAKIIYENASDVASYSGLSELAAQFQLILSSLLYNNQDTESESKIDLMYALNTSISALNEKPKNSELMSNIILRINQIIEAINYETIEPLFHIQLSVAAASDLVTFNRVVRKIFDWSKHLYVKKQFIPLIRKIYELIPTMIKSEVSRFNYNLLLEAYHALNQQQLNYVSDKPDWECYRSELTSYREEFSQAYNKNIPSCLSQQLSYTMNCKNLLNKMLRQIQLLTGAFAKPPSVLIMGSGYRGDMIPSSDVEPLILVSDKDDYSLIAMRAVVKLLHINMLCIGFALDAPYLLNDDYQPLLNTPQGLCDFVVSLLSEPAQLPLLYSLFHTTQIYGGHELAEEYHLLLNQKIFNSSEQCKFIGESGIAYNKHLIVSNLHSELTKVVDLKSRLINPLVMLIVSLGIYHRIYIPHPLFILDA